jgi:hypothetical protein
MPQRADEIYSARSGGAQTDVPRKANLHPRDNVTWIGSAMNVRMRLFVDGVGKGWAVVRCNACTDVDKYPALDAFDAPVVCKCGQCSDVRDALMAAVRDWPTPPFVVFDVLRFLPGHTLVH